MDSSTLQSRASTAYIPPHRTQLHPRMHLHSFSSPHPTSKSQTHKWFILFISLLAFPFLFYLFSTAQKIHHSSKFDQPKSQFFSVLIDSGPDASRVRVYQLLTEGVAPFTDVQMPLVAGSMKVRSGLQGLDNAGGLVHRLVEFAKGLVPRKEWGNTKVQLMAGGEEMEGLNLKVRDMILESCRQVLRQSRFAFKDEWARILIGGEKGVYAWVAVNYALGNLRGNPQETTGVVGLGGTSLQITFASREVAKGVSLQKIKLAGATYNLQTESSPKFGQDAVWKSLHELHNSREVISKKCLHPPCEIFPSLLQLQAQGKLVSQETLFYASEFFGLFPMATLSELEAAGQHYCESDWDKLRSQHHDIDDLDLLRYCFSSAYMVALLHDSLGVPMNSKRIGFVNHTRRSHLDWTLGAFILESMLEPLDMEVDKLDQIVGNESVTYFSLFAFLLIALLAVLFFLQWRKPQFRTIDDLEKGHYIVTRVPR